MGATCCDARSHINPDIEIYLQKNKECLSNRSAMGESVQNEKEIETK